MNANAGAMITTQLNTADVKSHTCQLGDAQSGRVWEIAFVAEEIEWRDDVDQKVRCHRVQYGRHRTETCHVCNNINIPPTNKLKLFGKNDVYVLQYIRQVTLGT